MAPAVATLDPETAAITVHARVVATINPPGTPCSSVASDPYNRDPIPEAEMIAPIRMNSGTAVKVKLVTEPQSVGATRPSASTPPPTSSRETIATPNRLNATGMPIARHAISAANIASPSQISMGS